MRPEPKLFKKARVLIQFDHETCILKDIYENLRRYFDVYCSNVNNISLIDKMDAQIILTKMSESQCFVCIAEIDDSVKMPFGFRCSYTNREADIELLIRCLQDYIEERFCLTSIISYDCMPPYKSEMPARKFIKYMLEEKSSFFLDALIATDDMEDILFEFSKLSDLERGNIVDYLTYVMQSELNSMAAQNATYILSRSGFDVLSILLKSEPKLGESDLIYRGWHVSVSFLDDFERLENYVKNLVFNMSPEWDRQRSADNRFTVDYYETQENAIDVLKQQIMTGSPTNLCLLNIYSLSQLSENLDDVNILTDRKLAFCESKTAKDIISESINMMLQHSRN